MGRCNCDFHERPKERCPREILVDLISTEIHHSSSCIPAAEGVLGGVALTGFIDVEKILRVVQNDETIRALFLEKKLPFQVLLVSLDLENTPID